MEKVLKLYALDRGNNVVPFPSVNNQVEIGDFRYNSSRMGAAPTISATVMWSACLDDVWNDETRFIKESVYALFNGEKYYLRQTPTSSYSNEDARYKHELELISERRILDNVYFYDVVSNVYDGKPRSNSTKVVFSGDIQEFIARLNASLYYCGLGDIDTHEGYYAIVDEGITSEDKLMNFEDKFFSEVLQEIYNQYELPYYFDGKVIHIGYSADVISEPFAQGINNALLSISKQNANFKVVNRVTGVGSTDNIPFYYPNKSPKGDISAESSNPALSVSIVNDALYSTKIGLDKAIEYKLVSAVPIGKTLLSRTDSIMHTSVVISNDSFEYTQEESGNFKFIYKLIVTGYMVEHSPDWEIRNPYIEFTSADGSFHETISWFIPTKESLEEEFDLYLEKGTYTIKPHWEIAGTSLLGRYEESLRIDSTVPYIAWTYEDKEVNLRSIGLSVEGAPQNGNTITQRLVKRIDTSTTLLPSIYRETDGKQRFYNAVNGGYAIDGYEVDFGDITFPNPWAEGKPSEHSVKFEDIKPTIKEATNKYGERIDMFADIAFDLDDNNETYEDEGGSTNIEHTYFFVKLKRLGFNLFDHAIEQQPMVVAMTSGDCGSCQFEVSVDYKDDGTPVNTVQVDANGNLVRDESGRVVCGVEDFQDEVYEVQESQQDTADNEVWIALKKEESTYGILMPHARKEEDGVLIEAEHRPTPNDDTFVLLGINLPEEYILDAEKRLENKLMEYLRDNNAEKFNFRIAFSRIYFEENPTILQHLNENSRISLIYNDKTYSDLYVSSFSYSMSQSEVLPQISVELKDSLSISQNALQNAISEIKGDMERSINSIDVLGRVAPYVLRKDVDDIARGTIDFKKGIKFGEGGKVEILDNNSAKLTIEYLEVTKKATFTSLEIQEKTHVGGQLLITPAAMNCGDVEEFEDYYRCYFQTKGESGDEIYNQFAVGDQAICQTFNAWRSKYYWRLVVEVGKDYIDLSKSNCDEGSDIPEAGDKIIQFGNQNDTSRQNAIVLAAHGKGSPYFVQYQGIHDFTLPNTDDDQRLVTKLSPNGNLITGAIKMLAGSTGLEQFNEWASKQTQIDNAQETAENAQEEIDNLQVGGNNLLRNSGFTGDYLSEQLADEKVLDTTTEMYSPWHDHWTYSSGISPVELANISMSGKGVQFGSSENSLSQALQYATAPNTVFMVSFKAKSTATSSDITVVVGGQSITLTIGNSWNRYVAQVTTSSISNFSIRGSSFRLCEVQLEVGNKATSWKPSILDNGSDRAYWQSMKYLQQSVQDASTTFMGGLGLTQTIMVGNYDSSTKEMSQVTGGMSGIHNNDNDVAFWGGGTLEQAIHTVQDYLTHGEAWQPTQEELAQMAKYVVTHGGKAILNDVILRGIIYASGGKFSGEIEANRGRFGELSIISNLGWGDSSLIGTRVYDNDEIHKLDISPEQISIIATDNDELKERIIINPYWYPDRYDLNGIVHIDARDENHNAIYIGQGNIEIVSGKIITPKIEVEIATPNSEEYINSSFIDIDLANTYQLTNYYLPKMPSGYVMTIEASSREDRNGEAQCNVLIKEEDRGQVAIVEGSGRTYSLDFKSMYKIVGVGLQHGVTEWRIYKIASL